MKITWKIEKKRGNFRPILSWTITLEPFEQELAVSRVEVTTTIPKPPTAWESFCYPGVNERAEGWTCQDCLILDTPGHKTGSSSGSTRLPWRENREYPEVEEGFTALRDAFEQELMAVYDSLPMHETGALENSSEARKHLAPGFAAQRLLCVVGGEDRVR
ncbi:MAG: hypothetical protein CSA21_05700 [Deltaproteobacteria bacterium]|nr:MAG: hypothetical protein CSA21_05700 [Deltaproteobacteria bacterium]